MQKLCQPFYKKFKRNLRTILILTIITENISKAGKSLFFFKDGKLKPHPLSFFFGAYLRDRRCFIWFFNSKAG